MIRTPVGSRGSFIFEVGAVDKLAEPKKNLNSNDRIRCVRVGNFNTVLFILGDPPSTRIQGINGAFEGF